MRWLYMFGIAGLLSAASEAPDVKVVEEIVAKVNGDVITRGELEKVRALVEAELRGQGKSGDELVHELKGAEADALREKIDQLLLLARAKELDIRVDAEITRHVAKVQAVSNIADPDQFHQWVYEQSGMTFEDWKQRQTDDELKRRVISQEVGSHINVPNQELHDYYDQHKSDFVRQEQVFLREILVATGDGSPEAVAAAKKKAEDLVTRAHKGEKFADLARIYSDAETAKNEGQLGAFKKGELIKELEDAAFKNYKGYISDPIRTKAGFEILKAEEHYATGQAAFEDVKDEIMEKMYMARIEPEMRRYLTKLREDAFIQIRGGFVDSGAAPGKDTSWKDPAMLKPATTTKEEVAAHSGKKKHVWGLPVPQ